MNLAQAPLSPSAKNRAHSYLFIPRREKHSFFEERTILGGGISMRLRHATVPLCLWCGLDRKVSGRLVGDRRVFRKLQTKWKEDKNLSPTHVD